MANDDGRCECGCRIFFDKPLFITTASGGIFNIPSRTVVECIRCARTSLIKGGDGERKLIETYHPGQEAERDIFTAALKDWRNDRPDAKTPDFLTIDPEDKKDFSRLDLNPNDFKVHNEPSMR